LRGKKSLRKKIGKGLFKKTLQLPYGDIKEAIVTVTFN
jgi:hypothetical protein